MSATLYNTSGHADLIKNREETDKQLPCVPGVRREINPYILRTQKIQDRYSRKDRPLTASLSAQGLGLYMDKGQGRSASTGALRPLSASALDLRRHQAHRMSQQSMVSSSRDLRTTAKLQAREEAKKRALANLEDERVNGHLMSEATMQARAQMRNPIYKPTMKQPNWILNDREVLRFFVYFEEPVHEGGALATSGFRVRKLALHYYVADTKIALEEGRQVNSGIPQGRFMKPTLVTKRNGQPYKPQDFQIGGDITLNGRKMVIVDADPKTRATYKSLGQPLGPALPYPDDGFNESRQRMENTRRHFNKPRRPKGEFYNKEDRVLRFYCAYKDDRRGGGEREYVLQYYLLNDTVEVTEIPKEGYQHFSNLLRRQKLPRDSLFVPAGYGGAISPRDPQRGRVPFVSWEDLNCGDTIYVYGRRLFMHSCDRSTLDWYRRQGVVQRPLKLYQEGGGGFLESNADHPMRVRYGAPVPPYNGFGAQDDLYAMGLALEPVNDLRQEEYENFIKSEDKTLRFEAKLVNAGEFNLSRDFVVNYFLGDDTVSVFEPPIKNSGIVGGLFLARGRYKKFLSCQNDFGTENYPIGGGRGGRGGSMSRWLRPTDFYPGAIVQFEMPSTGSKLFCLKIISSDDYTRRLQATDSYHFPWSSVQLSLMKLSERLAVANAPVRTKMRMADQIGQGILPEGEFRRLLRSLENEASQYTDSGMNLTDKELDEIVEAFRSDHGDGVLYPDVVDCITILSPISIREQEREKQGKSAMTVEEAMGQMLERDYAARPTSGGGRIRQSFRRHDRHNLGAVSVQDWFQVLNEHDLQGLMTKEKAEMVVLDNDTRGDGTLDYNRLCDRVFPGDFDRQHNETTVKLTQRLVGSPITSPNRKTYSPNFDPEDDFEAFENAQNRALYEKAQTKTLKHHLDKVNCRTHLMVEQGEKETIIKAMCAFSSSFARMQRKKMLRKNFMAFDTRKTGKVGRKMFEHAVDEVSAEFFIDFDAKDKTTLSEFFFPSDTAVVNYEALLNTICLRDYRKALALRKQAIQDDDLKENLFMKHDASRQRDFGGTLKLFNDA